MNRHRDRQNSKRKLWSVTFVIGLSVLVLATLAYRRTPITRQVVAERLVRGMTVAQVEDAFALSRGALKLQPDVVNGFHVVLVNGESGLSFITPQDHITLAFGNDRRLEWAWYELIYRADELDEGQIELRV
ncbi:MAG: hypothetical protein ABL962_12395 [Fimbriimonadaceae bacterium]